MAAVRMSGYESSTIGDPLVPAEADDRDGQ
jgi:hypothetical protein